MDSNTPNLDRLARIVRALRTAEEAVVDLDDFAERFAEQLESRGVSRDELSAARSDVAYACDEIASWLATLGLELGAEDHVITAPDGFAITWPWWQQKPSPDDANVARVMEAERKIREAVVAEGQRRVAAGELEEVEPGVCRPTGKREAAS